MADLQGAPLVVVTGASGGIGAAVCARLAADGYGVVAVDTGVPGDGDAAGGTDAASAPGAGEVATRRLSVCDAEAVDDLAAWLSSFGAPVHGLVNGAGVLRTGTVAETAADDLRALLDVNTLGVFLMSRAVTGVMCAQRPSDPTNSRAVVTIASNSAVVPRAGMAAYAASKAAAAHFTRSLGLEVARHGIRCDVVSPGTTRTPMVDAMWGGVDRADSVVAGDPEAFKGGIPLGRVADPDDVAGVVAFLLGPDARHVTLQEIVVDGGAAQR